MKYHSNASSCTTMEIPSCSLPIAFSRQTTTCSESSSTDKLPCIRTRTASEDPLCKGISNSSNIGFDRQACTATRAAIEQALCQVVSECDFAMALACPLGEEFAWSTVSEQMEVLTGYSRDELRGKNLRLFAPDGDEDLGNVFLLNKAFSSESSCTVVQTYRRKSGELFRALVHVESLTMAQCTHSRELQSKLCLLVDVTDEEAEHGLDMTEISKSISVALSSVRASFTLDDISCAKCHTLQQLSNDAQQTFEDFSLGQACHCTPAEKTTIDTKAMATGVVFGICMGLLLRSCKW